MSKLIVSEIESTGSSVQINDDLKVGSTGTNVITSGNVVAPSEDMIKNFKAFENPITVYDAAVSSTGVPGFTNAVPHVTSTSTGLTTGTALAATSTGNSLLTNFSADAVYVYNSSGTANCKNDYWGATIDIPKAFRGQNIVLSFDYRTEAASTNVTAADQWFVAVQDKTNTVAFLVTATALVSAGSAVGVVSSTGLAVGDKVWLEGGGNAQGDVSNSITEAYITEVTDSTNIKLSADYTPASTANSIGQTGFLTNTLQFLAAADSDTDKVGKNRKLSFKTADNTSQVNVFFQLRNTSSTVVHSLYFDNVYISSNMFLQASSQLKSEYYSIYWQDNVWYGSTGAQERFADTVLSASTSSLWAAGPSTPPMSGSKYLQIINSGTTTHFKAKQDITFAFQFSATPVAGSDIFVKNSSDQIIYRRANSNAYDNGSNAFTVVLAKDDYVYFTCANISYAYSSLNLVITPQTSDVILLESQDEIFTDWQDFTPVYSTGGGIKSGEKSRWRRVGSDMEIFWEFQCGTTSASVAYLEMPAGYSIDVSQFNLPAATMHVVGAWENPLNQTSANLYMCLDKSYPTRLYITYSDSAGYTYNVARDWNHLLASTADVALRVKVPIQGWNANFNPLLSMPLVEIGTDVGAYGGELGAPAYLYRQYVDLEETNTLGSSGLGTLTKGSSTSAFSFTASVDCIVSFSYSCGSSSSHDETGIISGPSSVPITDSTKSFVNTDYDGYRKSQGWIWAGDENPDNIATTFTMNAGDTMQLASTISGASYYTGASRTFSMVVQRIRQNTTMAHIIKPAVAIIKDVKAYNVEGGGASSGSWFTEDLNTVYGESWFVTLASNKFTLEPGTYKINWKTPFYNTGYSQANLYDETNTSFIASAQGLTNYINPTGGIPWTCEGDTTLTITSSTEFSIQSRVSDTKSTNGRGNQQNTDSTRNSIYTTVTIEKLK